MTMEQRDTVAVAIGQIRAIADIHRDEYLIDKLYDVAEKLDAMVMADIREGFDELVQR